MVESGSSEVIPSMIEKAKQIDARLDIQSLASIYETNTAYEDKQTVFVREFSFTQDQYNLHQRQYDFVFVCVDVGNVEELETITKKFYRITKNAGYLFYFSQPTITPTITKILEECNFVAINTIDISKDYDIISAKKMHGWEHV